MVSRRDILTGFAGILALRTQAANAANTANTANTVDVRDSDRAGSPPPSKSPTPTQTGAAPILQLADTPLDGPTWLLANKVFEVEWANPGGDWRDANEQAQGAAAYATASINGPGPQNVVFDVTALTKRWLETGNSGLHLRAISGPPITIASRTHPAERAPTLHVVSSTGTHDCPCLASLWIDASAGSPIVAEVTRPTTLLRFDLSKVDGTPT